MNRENEILEKLYDLKQSTELAISLVESKLVKEIAPGEFQEVGPEEFAIGNWLVRPRRLGREQPEVPVQKQAIPPEG